MEETHRRDPSYLLKRRRLKQSYNRPKYVPWYSFISTMMFANTIITFADADPLTPIILNFVAYCHHL